MREADSTKLTEEFIAAMMDVVNNENNALIFTDEELLFLINEQLPAEARIHADTVRSDSNGIGDFPMEYLHDHSRRSANQHHNASLFLASLVP